MDSWTAERQEKPQPAGPRQDPASRGGFAPSRRGCAPRVFIISFSPGHQRVQNESQAMSSIYIYIYVYIYIYMSQDSIQCSQEKAALRMHVFHPSQACKWLSLQHLRFQLQPRHSSRRNASSQSTRCRATKEPVSIEMWLLHQLQVQLVGEVGWAQIFLAPFHV